MSRLLLALALLLTAIICTAQVVITGTVLAKDDKSPIPQANVVEKSTQNGTLTNTDGTFTITVSDTEATLIISFIGMITTEYPLNGQRHVVIKIKSDCANDFFDSGKIFLYVNSGVIHTPIGGRLEVASPWVLHGVVKAAYGYQTDLGSNVFQNAQVEFCHYVSNCNFDIDFRWSYRDVSFDNVMFSTGNSFEADFSKGQVFLTGGYSHLDYNQTESGLHESSSGAVFGMGYWFNSSYIPKAAVKVAFYQKRIEYQASIAGGYKHLNFFIKFYKLNTFNELSIGIGSQIH